MVEDGAKADDEQLYAPLTGGGALPRALARRSATAFEVNDRASHSAPLPDASHTAPLHCMPHSVRCCLAQCTVASHKCIAAPCTLHSVH